jgi:hypothetical protein
MAYKVKNFIHFYGGSFGDVVTTIVNNGVVCIKHDWLRDNEENTVIDLMLLDSLGLQTICGHNKQILDLGLNNYTITIDDPKILNIVTDRLFIINKHTPQQRYDILKQYFDKKLWATLGDLSLQDQIKILKRKYASQYKQTLPATKIDCSCVFDIERLLSTLDKHFTFDHNIAHTVWNKWYSKQEQLGFVPDK